MKKLYRALGDHMLTKDISAESLIKTEHRVVEMGQVLDLTPLPDRVHNESKYRKSPHKREEEHDFFQKERSVVSLRRKEYAEQVSEPKARGNKRRDMGVQFRRKRRTIVREQILVSPLKIQIAKAIRI